MGSRSPTSRAGLLGSRRHGQCFSAGTSPAWLAVPGRGQGGRRGPAPALLRHSWGMSRRGREGGGLLGGGGSPGVGEDCLDGFHFGVSRGKLGSMGRVPPNPKVLAKVSGRQRASFLPPRKRLWLKSWGRGTLGLSPTSPAGDRWGRERVGLWEISTRSPERSAHRPAPAASAGQGSARRRVSARRVEARARARGRAPGGPA